MEPHDTDTVADLVRELTVLAREQPARLGERLARLPQRAQAELALRLPPRERLELLLHAPRPMRLVRALPDVELYLTVREVGPADAIPLLALASHGQITHLLDLEAWRREAFDAERAGAWVALLVEAGEPVVRRFLTHADDELLVLLFQRWLRVQPIAEDEDPSVHGHGHTEAGDERGVLSPDGFHHFRPLIAEHGAAARVLASVFFHEQQGRYFQIVHDALWELPLELEDRALHWRASRLEEHGFPRWEEAVEVYGPPRGGAPPPRVPEVDDADTVAAPRTALRVVGHRSLVLAATDLLDEAVRERVLHEMASLGNRLLVADSADTGDPDAHRSALARAASYLGLGLALRDARSPDAAARTIAATPLLDLFREGFAPAAELGARARRLAALVPRLDPPLAAVVEALLGPRPFHVGADGSQRDFRSLEELEEARAALDAVASLHELLDAICGHDETSVPLSTLLLTAIAWRAVHAEARCTPLPETTLRAFLRLDPATVEGAMAGLLAGRPVLREMGRTALERLREETGALDPDRPIDPRWISCLLLETAPHEEDPS